MSDARKPLVWLHGEIKTPPLSRAARLEAGLLLRRLQRGETLATPHYELRIVDQGHNWRILHRVDRDAIVIAEVFDKKARATSVAVIARCKDRLRRYDKAAMERTRT